MGNSKADGIRPYDLVATGADSVSSQLMTVAILRLFYGWVQDAQLL
jgi:hypothetical protein